MLLYGIGFLNVVEGSWYVYIESIGNDLYFKVLLERIV